jgi:hypothetical protein
MVEGKVGGVKFNGFISKVCVDSFPSTPVITFKFGDKELVEGTIVYVLSEARRRGAVDRHVTVGSELTTHRAG